MSESYSYQFGRFCLNPAERTLLREGESVALTPKVFEILLALVENGGQLVEKDNLMKRVWPDTFVEEGNLTQNISLLRKALGETPNGPQFIETVPRRGYRFVAAVSKDTNGRNGSAKPDAGASPGSQSKAAPAEISSATQLLHRLPNRTLVITGCAILLTLVSIVFFIGHSKAVDRSSIDSIAVLPFIDDASDSDAEYLNDKIAETIINSLSKLPKLRVVPRSVVAGYRGREIDPRKVGQELNVRAVLTGRVRRHGDTISIQADLIDVDNVAQLWGQHYDHSLADALLVQDDISRDIFENLRLKLNVEERKQLDAYRFYVKGRNAWNKRTEDGLLQGIEFFQKAIDTDPNYAAAYAGLADCYNMLVVYGVQQPKDGFPKAKEAAVKALDIDDSLAEAHTSLAFMKFRWDRDRVESEQEFQQAIKLKPSYAPAHQWYSSYLVALGRFEEAIAEARRTQELEPLSLIASSHLGWILYLSGQNDKAIEQCSKILTLDPNFFPALRYRGLTYEQKGMYKEAVEDFQKGVKLSGSPLMLALLGHAYAASGQRGEAQRVLGELQDLEGKRYVSPYTVAAIFAGLGDKDQAFKWLERANDERDIWLMNLKVDPVFSRLTSDKRFSDLLTRAGLNP